MWQWLKAVWCKYNPFDLDDTIAGLVDGFELIAAKLDRVDRKLDQEIAAIELELSWYKTLLHVIGETMPDMLWMKDLDGKYMYANPAIRLKLLFSTDPIGKTDIELSSAAKAKYGNENHTFGEKCSNSDKIVIDLATHNGFTAEQGRFLESGKIKGKMVYLEVFKAPVYVDGQLVGVCGAGRDMTVYVEAYRANGCSTKCPNADDIFKRYEFHNDEEH